MATYRAFISYSHQDSDWAKWLHRRLERYRVPSHLGQAAAQSARSIGRVFRDRDELATGQFLADHLAAALDQSDNLIVLCSPEAAQSKWVNEEIRQFRQAGKEHRIFCFSVSDQGPVFPPALLEPGRNGVPEPLAADIREWADGRRLAFLKIVAGLLDVPLDQLVQRDRQRRRRNRVYAALLAVSIIGLMVFAAFGEQAKRYQKRQAESLASGLIDIGVDLRARLDLQSSELLNQRALDYLEEVPIDEQTPSITRKVGLAFRELGLAKIDMGRESSGRVALEKSLELFQHLYRLYQLEEDLFEVGQAAFYIGQYISLGSEPWLATPYMRQYKEVSDLLLEKDPTDATRLLEVSYAVNALMQAHLRTYDRLRFFDAENDNQLFLLKPTELIVEAESAIAAAEKAYQSELAGSEAPADYFWTAEYNLGTTLSWGSDIYDMLGQLSISYELLTRYVSLARVAVEMEPANKYIQENLAIALLACGRDAASLGLETAEPLLREAADQFEFLLKLDPESQVAKGYLTELYHVLLPRLSFTKDELLALPVVTSVVPLDQAEDKIRINYYLMLAEWFYLDQQPERSAAEYRKAESLLSMGFSHLPSSISSDYAIATWLQAQSGQALSDLAKERVAFIWDRFDHTDVSNLESRYLLALALANDLIGHPERAADMIETLRKRGYHSIAMNAFLARAG